MKKILFASTALIATAGMAAADVNFGGYGRFGIGYNESRTTESTIIVSRFRLNIDGDATTDGGVRFSARVRLQADEAPSGTSSSTSTQTYGADTVTNTTTTVASGNGEANAAGLNGARFSVEYEGLRVDVGNVAGALDNLPGYYGYETGLEGMQTQYSGANYSFMGYTTGAAGSNGVYARYAVGDFAFAASYDTASVTTTTVSAVTTVSTGVTAAATTSTTTVNGDRWDMHAAYTFGNITAALGYGETEAGTTKMDMTVLTLGGTWGAFSGNLIVGDESTGTVATSDTFYGISGTYDVSSATTIGFAMGDGSGTGDTQNYGIGVKHDLGGGVSLRGGIGNAKTLGVSTTRADFGAVFNF